MKIWYECGPCPDDPKLFIDWYKHHKDHKWKGFTMTFGALGELVQFTWVNDYKKYKKGMKLRRKK